MSKYTKYLFTSPLLENTNIDNNVTVNLWGKSITLGIDYNVYDDSEIHPKQKHELKKFLKNFNIVNDCLDDVKQYCIQRDGIDIPDKNIPDIFKYVQPKSIFIKMAHNEVVGIALMCEYIFDVEHGIAIVFRNGKLIDIGSQNIIL